jgi:hypothetical protein
LELEGIKCSFNEKHARYKHKYPLFFRGEEASPLKPNLMRPFTRPDLDFSKTIFNGELCSIWRTNEELLEY